MARQLAEIAIDIRRDWVDPKAGKSRVNYAAAPYLEAMATIYGGVEANYGQDSAKSVVLYFLANASSWRGETARKIKAELKAMVR